LSRTLMVIAGEASGDLHGSALIEKLFFKHPDLIITGIGGDKMRNAGMETLFDIKDMAFLGFAEVVKHLPFIKRVQRILLKTISERKIDAVVLIDYPGFNLNFARKAKKLGVKLIYYISPQLWAWGRHRVRKVKRLIDEMLVVFPFEKDFYSEYGIKAEYVGHPLVERINKFNFDERREFLNKIGLNESDKYILLMPGSRMHEIELMYSEIASAAVRIAAERNLKIVAACSDNIDESALSKLAPGNDIKILKGNTYNLMRHAEFGIIKSGTSSLESALIGMPFIVVYKTSGITYFIGKSLVKINNIAMPNIIAGEEIIDELIQNEVNSENIYRKTNKYFTDTPALKKLVEKLKIVREKLSAGNYSASERTAEIIGSIIYEAE